MNDGTLRYRLSAKEVISTSVDSNGKKTKRLRVIYIDRTTITPIQLTYTVAENTETRRELKHITELYHIQMNQLQEFVITIKDPASGEYIHILDPRFTGDPSNNIPPSPLYMALTKSLDDVNMGHYLEKNTGFMDRSFMKSILNSKTFLSSLVKRENYAINLLSASYTTLKLIIT